MGCDIHMFIEYRNSGCPWQADSNHKELIRDTCLSRCTDKKDYCDECSAGKFKQCDMAYRHFNQINATSRDYQLFGLLASVRGPGPREPKGLPHDVSDIVCEASASDGGHSHSYISLEEFEKVLFEEYEDKDYPYDPTDKHNIWYDWEDKSIEHPPDFTSIVTYGKMLKEKHNVEKYILDNDSVNDVEVRLIFWFDS